MNINYLKKLGKSAPKDLALEMENLARRKSGYPEVSKKSNNNINIVLQELLLLRKLKTVIPLI